MTLNSPQSPIGRFLEISIQSREILESLAFYRELGFHELSVGEMWSHPYVVMTDGRCFLGLHDRPDPVLALSYVLPDLAKQLSHLAGLGVALQDIQTDDDVFNQVRFQTQEQLTIMLLEARTFSPANLNGKESFSQLGHFVSFAIQSSNSDQSKDFWESVGFVSDINQESRLSSDGLTLDVLKGSECPLPCLYFETNLETLFAKAANLGLSFNHFKENEGRPWELGFKTPEGLQILVSEVSKEN